MSGCSLLFAACMNLGSVHAYKDELFIVWMVVCKQAILLANGVLATIARASKIGINFKLYLTPFVISTPACIRPPLKSKTSTFFAFTTVWSKINSGYGGCNVSFLHRIIRHICSHIGTCRFVKNVFKTTLPSKSNSSISRTARSHVHKCCTCA